ncbi:hypothetical protein BDR22DRAFT_886941 [Usnea florida]
MAGGYAYQDRKVTAPINCDPSAPDGIRDLDLFALAFKSSFALAVPHAHHGWHDNSEGSTNISESCAVAQLIKGKSRAALLVVPKPNAELPDHAHTEKIWPLVEEADLPTHCREGISGVTILIVIADKPSVRTGKGTSVRKQTEKV